MAYSRYRPVGKHRASFFRRLAHAACLFMFLPSVSLVITLMDLVRPSYAFTFAASFRQRLFPAHVLRGSDTISSHPLWIVSATSKNMHDVGGVECQAVTVDIEVVGDITILEATAKAQESLVEEAIRLDDDDTVPGGIIREGDVYGSVLWPSASAVANHILSRSSFEYLSKTTILELGSGSGLVSIALARGGAMKVVASDYESVPLQLLKYSESKLNPAGYCPRSIETGNCLSVAFIAFQVFERTAVQYSSSFLLAADAYPSNL
mmetsp:Transcript_60574/g.179550  ORF Transcript_60574/g.179550 Transcript_60574/m.179550 type:complete len:264 (-) Transcript_60574:483-1274(-)